MTTYRVRVYFEDTDCGGIVYHTNYIKYCERARSEIFFKRNMQPFDEECGFVLKRLYAEFITPAKLGDMLEVRSEFLTLKNASIELEQNIYKIFDALKNESCEKKVFSAQILLAFINAKLGKPSKIPWHIMEILR